MKIRNLTFVSILGLALVGVHPLCAAQNSSDLGNNAALQYLSAFLQLEDADLQEADVKELSGIVAGTQAYDEAKFGKLVEKNTTAIETMIVGSRLEPCDWGLAQRGNGPETPVTYFWRARALGRLDLLYVLRAFSKGDHDEAVRALAAGIRFSRQFSNGGPLVPALIAKGLLLQQLSIANRLLDSGKLNASQKERLRAAAAALGSDGVDWQAAMHVEMGGLKTALDEERAASDPRQYYKRIMGNDAPSSFHGITPEDYASLERISAAFVRTLKDDDAAPVHQAVDAASPIVREWIPNPDRLVAAKQELKSALEETRKRLEK
jgi:hypothetical protein